MIDLYNRATADGVRDF